METSAYNYALSVSLTLLLFFSYRFIFGKLPDKEIYKTYLQSRMIMGFALLALSVNYSIHLFAAPRFENAMNAIYMNLSTYFLAVWLFSCALMMLLVDDYFTRQRFTRHIVGWLAYTIGFGVARMMLPQDSARWALLIVMAMVFLVYSFRLARRLLRTYRKAVKMLDQFHSDNIAAYIRWMSVFTYWAIVFGVGQGVFTFVPDRYVFFWIVSAIPFYIYLYVSYKDYMLFYKQVEIIRHDAASEEIGQEEDLLEESNLGEGDAQPYISASLDSVIAEKLSGWIAKKGFAKGGITIVELARDIGTNRTYVSAYINRHFQMSFREWLNDMRLAYAKELLVRSPELTMVNVAQTVGYVSPSYFTKAFKQAEGVTPAQWRKDMMRSAN